MRNGSGTEASGIVLTTTIPFLGATKTSIDHVTKTIRILAEPDLSQLCAFVRELPKDVLDVVSAKASRAQTHTHAHAHTHTNTHTRTHTHNCYSCGTGLFSTSVLPQPHRLMQ